MEENEPVSNSSGRAGSGAPQKAPEEKVCDRTMGVKHAPRILKHPTDSSPAMLGRKSKKSVTWEDNRPKEDETPKRLWLCDTGCPFDLTSEERLPDNLKKCVLPAGEIQDMETANGTITAERVFPMQIAKLETNIMPYLLPSTPDVLTIGRRCVREGFGFYWPPGSEEPSFELPGYENHGQICKLKSIQDVPYLSDSLNVEIPATRRKVAPAPSALPCAHDSVVSPTERSKTTSGNVRKRRGRNRVNVKCGPSISKTSSVESGDTPEGEPRPRRK